MTKKRRSRPAAVVITPDEPRWAHNKLVIRPREGRAYNVTATPLDAYHDGGIIGTREFNAGDKLRDLWRAAGRCPRVTADMKQHIAGLVVMTDDQATAWGEFARRLQRLDPIDASAVWNVCCMDEPAEIWAKRMGRDAHTGIQTLRAALLALSCWRSKQRRSA